LTSASKVPKSALGWAWATCPSGPPGSSPGQALRCSDQAAVAQLAPLRHTLPQIRLILCFSAASTAERSSIVWFLWHRGLISQADSLNFRAFTRLRWSEHRDAPSAFDFALALEGAEKRRARRKQGHSMSDRRERSERREFCGPAWTEHRRVPAAGRRLRGRPDFLGTFVSSDKSTSPSAKRGETALDFSSLALIGNRESTSAMQSEIAFDFSRMHALARGLRRGV